MIYIVEDDTDICELEQYALHNNGFETTGFGDGKRNMGLGLSVCQAIVRAHGGSISARNLSEGAEFTFRLPLPKEEH